VLYGGAYYLGKHRGFHDWTHFAASGALAGMGASMYMIHPAPPRIVLFGTALGALLGSAGSSIIQVRMCALLLFDCLGTAGSQISKCLCVRCWFSLVWSLIAQVPLRAGLVLNCLVLDCQGACCALLVFDSLVLNYPDACVQFWPSSVLSCPGNRADRGVMILVMAGGALTALDQLSEAFWAVLEYLMYVRVVNFLAGGTAAPIVIKYLSMYILDAHLQDPSALHPTLYLNFTTSIDIIKFINSYANFITASIEHCKALLLRPPPSLVLPHVPNTRHPPFIVLEGIFRLGPQFCLVPRQAVLNPAWYRGMPLFNEDSLRIILCLDKHT